MSDAERIAGVTPVRIPIVGQDLVLRINKLEQELEVVGERWRRYQGCIDSLTATGDPGPVFALALNRSRQVIEQCVAGYISVEAEIMKLRRGLTISECAEVGHRFAVRCAFCTSSDNHVTGAGHYCELFCGCTTVVQVSCPNGSVRIEPQQYNQEKKQHENCANGVQQALRCAADGITPQLYRYCGSCGQEQQYRTKETIVLTHQVSRFLPQRG